MNPLTLEFANFQSHKHSKLDFTKLDKITLVIGEYEGEERKSNGAGKSSLFDVIEWILYDQTRANNSKTASVEDLIRDNEKEMWGIYTFISHDTNTYRVTKTYKRRKTNPLELKFEIKNGEEWTSVAADTLAETRQKIVKAVGYDKSIFESTVFCKQHEVAGIASEDSDTRLALVKKILKLDKWAEYAKAAKTLLDKLKEELETYSDLLQKAETAKLELKGKQEVIQLATEKAKVYSLKVEAQKKKIESIRKEIDEINKILGAIEQLKAALKKSNERRELIAKELKNLAVQRDSLTEKISAFKTEDQAKQDRVREIDNSKPDKTKLINEYKTVSEEKDVIQARIGSLQGLLEATSDQGRTLRAELDEFKKLGIGKCSKCKNEVTEEHKEVIQKDFEDKLTSLRAKALEYRQKIEEGKVSLEEKKGRLEKITEQQELYNALIEEKNKIIERLRSIAELLGEYTVSLENNKVQIETYKQETVQLQSEATELQQKIGAFGGAESSTKHASLVASLQGENKTLEELQGQVATLTAEANVAKAKVEELKQTIERAKNAEKETEQLRKKISWYEVLQQDFQKTIPTMILENSAAMIEAEVNKNLSTLSDGFTVSINTQHKNKTNENVKEVFDIQVTVGDKTRAFELLSGGERFRVAFALRVALSIIQSQETGVQNGAIFYDEPFNDLDEDGLDKIQEVFVYLSSIFEHQLAITHQNRLKETFNDVICVKKTKDGATLV